MNRLKSIVTTLIIAVIFVSQANAFSRGIYITESTALHSAKLTQLIEQSKKYNIDTFVVDVNRIGGKTFANNIKKIQDSGIHFVARVVIFPHGGTHAQVTDQRIWNKRLGLVKYAVSLGASAIQLDYIRYAATNPAKPERAQYILKVVQHFKDAIAKDHVPLQMDIFGVAALKPAHTIGQDVGILAKVIDVFCPMVYPSHYEPFRIHAVQPYETVYRSVDALKKQLTNYPNVKIIAYIEIYNYRFMLSHAAKMKYIAAEIKAVHDAGGNGWYVWSPNNHYAPLFTFLASRGSDADKNHAK